MTLMVSQTGQTHCEPQASADGYPLNVLSVLPDGFPPSGHPDSERVKPFSHHPLISSLHFLFILPTRYITTRCTVYFIDSSLLSSVPAPARPALGHTTGCCRAEGSGQATSILSALSGSSPELQAPERSLSPRWGRFT